MLVREIESATLWARDPERARARAAELGERLGIPVRACASVAEAAAEADIIVTTTPSREPLLLAEHVRAGQHVTAMGSDAEHKNEVDPRLLAAADYFCDRLSQTRALGELQHAIAAGQVAADAVFPELGQVIAGQAPGRSSPEALTFCDLTGTGIQDTAIATLAFDLCRRNQAGTRFTS